MRRVADHHIAPNESSKRPGADRETPMPTSNEHGRGQRATDLSPSEKLVGLQVAHSALLDLLGRWLKLHAIAQAAARPVPSQPHRPRLRVIEGSRR